MNPKRRAKKAEESASPTKKRRGKSSTASTETLTAAPGDAAHREASALAESSRRPAPSPDGPEGVEEQVRDLNAEFESERDQWRAREDGLLRSLAERENQLRRLYRDQEQAAWRSRADLLASLLDVLDDFDRALSHAGEAAESEFGQGIGLIAQRLQETLEKLGLEPIAARGEKFDPACHEALMTVASDEVDRGHVVDEIQRGYRLGERVLRPSKVSVAG